MCKVLYITMKSRLKVVLYILKRQGLKMKSNYMKFTCCSRYKNRTNDEQFVVWCISFKERGNREF